MPHPTPYNKTSLKEYRQTLRKNQTEAEQVLWRQLKNKQLNGFKFWRQYSVGSFILDFYCPKLRLALELDGGHHATPSSQTYDQERSNFLEKQNIRVVRYWNNEVLSNLEGVLVHLFGVVEELRVS